MNNQEYTKYKLNTFLRQTLSKNKSNNIYLNLKNFNMLCIQMNVKDGETEIYLIGYKLIYLGKVKLIDGKSINNFTNYIDVFIQNTFK